MSTPVVHLSASCSLAGKVSQVLSRPKGQENAADVFTFLGIPYTQPPVNELRFKPPQPVTLWDGQRQTTEYGNICLQNLAVLDKYPIPGTKPDPSKVSEDCLFLNVWTPTLEKGAKLPVMFWIHGGAFIQGFSNMYPGTTLAAFHNVVYVAINYRIGPFGFLCTGDSASPGNYGMLDQIEALKWVQKYISKFGGDPDNVTIFGESAGGISVSLLSLSKLADGLFKRAISQSGTALSNGMVWQPTVAAFLLRQKLTELGWPSGTGEEILSFLSGQSAEKIFEKLGDSFRPVIDGDFLSTDPRGIYERSEYLHREYLLGCNNNEGAFLIDLMLPQVGVDVNNVKESAVRAMVQQTLVLPYGPKVAEQLVDAVLKEYIKVIDSSEEFLKSVSEFFGDILIVIPTIDTANFHSRKNKTYLYQYLHRPAYSNASPWVISDHGHEVPLVLGLFYSSSEIKFSDEDEIVAQQAMSYWTNFAKTGDPNGEGLHRWPVYNETTKSHLVISDPPSSGVELSRERRTFWSDTIPRIIKSFNEQNN